MSSTDIACFQFYFEKVADINMNSVGHSKTHAATNNTLLTRPKRKKKKAVRNAYNVNHATYEQLMKLVVCDKGQALVTKSMNQLMQGFYTYKVVRPWWGVLLLFQILKSQVIENVKNCSGCHGGKETRIEGESGNSKRMRICANRLYVMAFGTSEGLNWDSLYLSI